MVSFLLCILLLCSGCVNATYTFQVRRNGSFDADYKILVDSKTTDPAVVNGLMLELRKHFTEDKYEIQDYEEHGFSGIRISKKQTSLEELASPGKADEKNVDYSNMIMKGLSVTKGFMTNRFVLKSMVDLTFLNESFLEKQMQEYLPEGQAADAYPNGTVTVVEHGEKRLENHSVDRQVNVTVDDRELAKAEDEKAAEASATSVTGKWLTNATMKVVMRFPDRVTATNAGKISDNGKTLEWIVIPGTVNTLSAEGLYVNTTGVAVAWIVVGVTMLLLLCVIVILIKKKRK